MGIFSVCLSHNQGSYVWASHNTPSCSVPSNFSFCSNTWREEAILESESDCDIEFGIKTLKEQDMRLWSGIFWLWMVTSVGHLWTLLWIFELHKDVAFVFNKFSRRTPLHQVGYYSCKGNNPYLDAYSHTDVLCSSTFWIRFAIYVLFLKF